MLFLRSVFFFCFAAALAQADLKSELVEITRDSKVMTRVQYNQWSGEEPSPVIDFLTSGQKMNSVTAYLSVSDLSKKNQILCLMDSGLIHPWAENKEVLQYLTLIEQQKYTLRKSFEFLKALDLEKQQVLLLKTKPDDVIESVIYNSNGVCTFKILSQQKKYQIDQDCSLISDRAAVQSKYDSNDVFKEQWIEFNCYQKNKDEPLRAFIRDIDLLKMPGVKTGCIKSAQKVLTAAKCKNMSNGK